MVFQQDMESRIFTWTIWPLHMHRCINMSHNFVTEIKEKLTCSKIGTRIAFQRNMLSIMTNLLFILLVSQDPSAFLGVTSRSIWYWARNSVGRGSKMSNLFRVWFQAGPRWLQWLFQQQYLVCFNWASFTIKHPPLKPYTFDPKKVCDFWLYHDMINTLILPI